MAVFRGVKYTENKTGIDRSDFLSHVERRNNNPMFLADDTKISSYGCSFFMNMDVMHQLTKFPSKNKAMFLFNNADPSSEFEVVEKWEKNG